MFIEWQLQIILPAIYLQMCIRMVAVNYFTYDKSTNVHRMVTVN